MLAAATNSANKADLLGPGAVYLNVYEYSKNAFDQGILNNGSTYLGSFVSVTTNRSNPICYNAAQGAKVSTNTNAVAVRFCHQNVANVNGT